MIPVKTTEITPAQIVSGALSLLEPLSVQDAEMTPELVALQDFSYGFGVVVRKYMDGRGSSILYNTYHIYPGEQWNEFIAAVFNQIREGATLRDACTKAASVQFGHYGSLLKIALEVMDESGGDIEDLSTAPDWQAMESGLRHVGVWPNHKVQIPDLDGLAVLILTRQDLLKEFRHLRPSEIKPHHFGLSATIDQKDVVIFRDHPFVFLLKNRKGQTGMVTDAT